MLFNAKKIMKLVINIIVRADTSEMCDEMSNDKKCKIMSIFYKH